jgi:hypothetical protein
LRLTVKKSTLTGWFSPNRSDHKKAPLEGKNPRTRSCNYENCQELDGKGALQCHVCNYFDGIESTQKNTSCGEKIMRYKQIVTCLVKQLFFIIAG